MPAKRTVFGDAAVIICERGNLWRLALRRAMDSTGIPIRHCRSRQECIERVAAAPASLVILELDPAEPGEGLRCLMQLERRFSACQSIAFACGSSQDLEAAARQAGAVHFVRSVAEAPAVAYAVERHFAQLLERASSPAERIWASLPWTN